MPWAGWLIIGILVAEWIPVVREWVVEAVFILTALPTMAGLALIRMASGVQPAAIEGPIGIGPRLSGWALAAEYWSILKWPTLIWLAAIVTLFFWIAWGRRAGRSIRGRINLLVLIVGWPICFWAGTYLSPH
jgi:hypothetical protein